jgi:hypothetical protein
MDAPWPRRGVPPQRRGRVAGFRFGVRMSRSESLFDLSMTATTSAKSWPLPPRKVIHQNEGPLQRLRLKRGGGRSRGPAPARGPRRTATSTKPSRTVSRFMKCPKHSPHHHRCRTPSPCEGSDSGDGDGEANTEDTPTSSSEAARPTRKASQRASRSGAAHSGRA